MKITDSFSGGMLDKNPLVTQIGSAGPGVQVRDSSPASGLNLFTVTDATGGSAYFAVSQFSASFANTVGAGTGGFVTAFNRGTLASDTNRTYLVEIDTAKRLDLVGSLAVGTASEAVRIWAATGTRTAGQILTVGDGSAFAMKFQIEWDGRVNIKTPATAPTDGNLMAGSVEMYLDEVGNNLKVRAKYANGTTLKTATIALV